MNRTPGILALFAVLVLPALAEAEILLVGNKSDHTVDLIDVSTRTSRATLPTGIGPHEIAVSPSGTMAVVSNYGNRERPGNSLTVLDLERQQVVRTIDLGDNTRPHGMVWYAPGKLAVTAEGSRRLLVVKPESGAIESMIATEQDVSHMVAVLPDGSRAFVANIGSGSVTVIDLQGATKITDIPTGAGAEGLALSPDASLLWVTNRDADTLSLVDTGTLEITATIACPEFPIRVAITPDGARALVSTARSGEVVAFDTQTHEELARRKLDLTNAPDASRRLFGDRFGDSPVPVGLQMSRDGSRAWVAATQADAVVEIDTRTLEVVGLLRAGREPDGMALSRSD